MATKKTVQETNPEFLYVPIGNIVVLEQVRSNINTEADSFKSLIQSIKDKGILEPLLVTKGDGDLYTLICGERRLEAARQLELELIPVRIIEAGKESGETIALQLTENLQREDLNPIDQAKGILAYIQAKHPDKNYDVDTIMADLVRYEMRPADISEEIADTLSAISEIVGKSIRTMIRTISLLKLPPEIQAAIRAENLLVSQGYLFAANLDCPDRAKIFQDIMKTPVTYLTLEKLLTAWKKVKPEPGKTKPLPMTKQIASLRSVESRIEMGIATYTKPDLQALLDELRVFCALVELRIPIAPEPAPEKKKPPQV
ncbi:MAG: ParB/RepB/Spo0J family partition protein [Proteobacteria bacterium]|nr:ParB/RepB/Spo0J family partition protein [Pseudomonadota bacterium]